MESRTQVDGHGTSKASVKPCHDKGPLSPGHTRDRKIMVQPAHELKQAPLAQTHYTFLVKFM